jgi:hypothetical protein
LCVTYGSLLRRARRRRGIGIVNTAINARTEPPSTPKNNTCRGVLKPSVDVAAGCVASVVVVVSGDVMSVWVVSVVESVVVVEAVVVVSVVPVSVVVVSVVVVSVVVASVVGGGGTVVLSGGSSGGSLRPAPVKVKDPAVPLPPF